MKEIFVIYNKDTGFIHGGSGRIDRVRDAEHLDGSTISEFIQQILAKDPDRKVIYLPDQDLPSAAKHKIIDGKIVDLTDEDKQPEIEAKLIEEKINKETKALSIKSLKEKDELPADYSEQELIFKSC